MSVRATTVSALSWRLGMRSLKPPSESPICWGTKPTTRFLSYPPKYRGTAHPGVLAGGPNKRTKGARGYGLTLLEPAWYHDPTYPVECMIGDDGNDGEAAGKELVLLDSWVEESLLVDGIYGVVGRLGIAEIDSLSHNDHAHFNCKSRPHLYRPRCSPWHSGHSRHHRGLEAAPGTVFLGFVAVVRGQDSAAPQWSGKSIDFSMVKLDLYGVPGATGSDSIR